MKTKLLLAILPIMLLTSFCGKKVDRQGIDLAHDADARNRHRFPFLQNGL